MKTRRKKPVTASPKVSPLAVNPNAISFSLKQVAVVSGVALWAVRSAIWDRQLAAHFVGKRQIVLRADLEQWLASTPTASERAA
jgi:hypothetical protein